MKECNIVQDLLPLYIDGLTSEESNNMIRQHTEVCRECKKQLNHMQSPVDEIPIQSHADFKKNIRKHKRRITIRITIIAVLTLILGLLITLAYLWFKGYFNILERSTAPDGTASCIVYDRDITDSAQENGILVRFKKTHSSESSLLMFYENCSFCGLEWSPDGRYCAVSLLKENDKNYLHIIDVKNSKGFEPNIYLDSAVCDYFDYFPADSAFLPSLDYRFLQWSEHDNAILVYFSLGEHHGYVWFNCETHTIISAFEE